MEKNNNQLTQYGNNTFENSVDIRCLDLLTPNRYLHDSNLKAVHEKFLGVISMYGYNNGSYCRLKNRHLSDYMKINKKAISKILSKLNKENYVRVEIVEGERRIYLLK